MDTEKEKKNLDDVIHIRVTKEQKKDLKSKASKKGHKTLKSYLLKGK